ncbi:RIP metalloprotease RseP [Castellaniella sp.]|uniref:RIP metalloprotease RseP n=1 Tax=Castellaniella sp. TaxID=1955812 RepID=UPI003560CCC6
MLFTLLAFALALGLLITFHELGHYAVARWFGVRVERFSIGFGPVLLSRQDRHGTQWALSAIPLGGYVKMQNEPEPGASAAERRQAFNSQPLAQRAAIVLAGPLANLLLAVFLYAGLAVWGAHEPVALLGAPQAGTPAALAGVQAGDTIESVGDQAIASWPQARWVLSEPIATGGDVVLQLRTASGGARTAQLKLPANSMDPERGDPLLAVGLQLRPPAVVLGDVQPGGAAERAGLQRADRILSVAGIEAPDPLSFAEQIRVHPAQPVPLTVERGDVRLSLPITPDAVQEEGRTTGRIGVLLLADFPMVLVREGPLEGLATGLTRTLELSGLTLRMMGRMLTGDISIRNITGPVTIADYAGQSARIGLASYLNFMALISISLGVLNLLPVPMLDGGHLLLYGIEALRGGRPLSAQLHDTLQRVGLSLVLGLMTLALFNDFHRLFS